jgi:hypothetical protein
MSSFSLNGDERWLWPSFAICVLLLAACGDDPGPVGRSAAPPSMTTNGALPEEGSTQTDCDLLAVWSELTQARLHGSRSCPVMPLPEPGEPQPIQCEDYLQLAMLAPVCGFVPRKFVNCVREIPDSEYACDQERGGFVLTTSSQLPETCADAFATADTCLGPFTAAPVEIR